MAMDFDLRGEEAFQKLTEFTKALEQDQWSPQEISRLMITVGAFILRDLPSKEKRLAQHDLRKRALGTVNRSAAGQGNMELFPPIHPKTRALINRLEEVSQQHFKDHDMNSNLPIYIAHAHLLFEALIARGISLEWQDGLRGLFFDLYPRHPPNE